MTTAGWKTCVTTKPLVLIDEIASRRLVAMACEMASGAGVRPGMTLAQARALCPGLTDANHDPAGDLRTLHALGRWLMRFSPVVAPEPPDGIFLDVTGSERLFDGIDNLAQQVAAALQRLRIAASLAVAPTPGAAWALAASNCGAGRAFSPSPGTPGEGRGEGSRKRRAFDDSASIPQGPHPNPLPEYRERGQMQAAKPAPPLDHLPPSSLRIDPATTAMLHHLGIETIGQLLKLPRESLSQRFGPHLLLRLDQAFGRVPEVLVPLAYESPIRAAMEFDGAVESIEAIWLVFKNLIGQVLRQLIRRGCGARRVEVEFRRAIGKPVRRVVLLSRPSRDPSNLFNLLRCATENLESDDGFVAIRLSVPVFEQLGDEQGMLVDGEQQVAETELAHLVERLTVRLGQEAVARARLRESHLPERVVQPIDVYRGDACVARSSRISPIHVGTTPASPVVGVSSADQGVMRIAGDAGVAPTKMRAPRKARATQASPLQKQASPPQKAYPPVAPRPLHLLCTPAEIQVTSGPSHDAEGTPLTFVQGTAVYRLRYAAGPERIAAVWWEGRDKTRDYYDVESDEGRRFWIFRVAQTGRWYLHGEYE